MAIDASIPLSFNPQAQSGSNPNALLQMLAEVQQYKANERAIQGQNALRELFANPQNLDPKGNPTGDAMRKVMAIDPGTGLKLRQQIVQTEQAQASLANAQSETALHRIQLLHDRNGEAIQVYDDEMAKGTPEAQARADAQKVYSAGLKDLSSGGLFSPEQLAAINPQFDPVRARANAMNLKDRMELVQKERTAERQDRAEAERERHDLASEDRMTAALAHRDDAAANKGWTIGQVSAPDPNDPTKQIQVPVRMNAGTGQVERIDVKGLGDGATLSKLGSAPKGGAVSFADSDVDYWASVLKNGGHFPPGLARTAAGSDLVQRVMKKMGQGGASAGDFIANAATVKADESSLRNMTKMTDAATSFEQTASKNFDLALRLGKDAVPTDWGPWINRWVMNGETALGDKNIPPYVTAMLTGANEYAKIMSGSTGAQGSTVDSRREAAELFSPYLAKGQIENVIKVAKQDMANRKASLYGQVDEIKNRLRNAGSKEPTATEGDKKMEQKAISRKSAPEVGAIEKGYRFLGGDPSKPSSWEKVE